jgi:putative endonuclease
MGNEGGTPSEDTWEFKNTASGWFWLRRASNGHPVGGSIKSFASLRSCIQNAMRHGMPDPRRQKVKPDLKASITASSTANDNGRDRKGRKSAFNEAQIRADIQLVKTAVAGRQKAYSEGFSEGYQASLDPQNREPDSRSHGYVYILTSGRNGVLFTHLTGDLPRRILEHRNKLKPGLTSRNGGATTLVWFEAHDLITEAIRREKAIKAWPRQRKIRLIEAVNPRWKDITHLLLSK